MNTRKRRQAANGVTGDQNRSPEPSATNVAVEPISDGVLEMVTETLQQAGRYGTPHGQIAVVLASRLDNAHMETGSGIATLSRELERILEKALAGTHTETDELDQLERRRREKAARAHR